MVALLPCRPFALGSREFRTLPRELTSRSDDELTSEEDMVGDDQDMRQRRRRTLLQDQRSTMFSSPFTEETSQKVPVMQGTCILMGIVCAVTFYYLIQFEDSYMVPHHYFLGLEDLRTLEFFTAATRILVFQLLAGTYCRYIAHGRAAAVASIVSQALCPVLLWLFMVLADARDSSKLHLQLGLAVAVNLLVVFGANVCFRRQSTWGARLRISLESSLLHSLITVTHFAVCLFPFYMLGNVWLHDHAIPRVLVSVVFPGFATFLGRTLLEHEFSELAHREEFQQLELYVAVFMRMVISKAMAFQARCPLLVATTLCIQAVSSCVSLGLDPLLFRWSREGGTLVGGCARRLMSPLRKSHLCSQDEPHLQGELRWLHELDEEDRDARFQDKFFEVVHVSGGTATHYIQPNCRGHVLQREQVGAFPNFDEWTPSEDFQELLEEQDHEAKFILLINWDGFICAAENFVIEDPRLRRVTKFDDEDQDMICQMLYWVRDFKTLGKLYCVHTFAECMGIGLVAVSWPLLDKTRGIGMVCGQLALAIGFEVIGAWVTYLFLKKHYELEMNQVKHLLSFSVCWTYILAAAFMWMSELNLVKLFTWIEPIGCAVLRQGECASHL